MKEPEISGIDQKDLEETREKEEKPWENWSPRRGAVQ
jgi:hypothetical protein